MTGEKEALMIMYMKKSAQKQERMELLCFILAVLLFISILGYIVPVNRQARIGGACLSPENAHVTMLAAPLNRSSMKSLPKVTSQMKRSRLYI